MTEYYDQLLQEEKEELKEIIQLLYRQTFILERKYDRREKRLQINRDFRICNRHLEFIREYFDIMGIDVKEDSQDGIIYLQGETLMGDKVSKLITLYLLIMKLIYDEQMASVSTSSQVFTTMGEIHEKLGSFRLLSKQPSVTEVRKSIAFLKRYQIIEPLDILEELEGRSRILIYPTIHMVLLGDDARALLNTFTEAEDEHGDDETEI